MRQARIRSACLAMVAEGMMLLQDEMAGARTLTEAALHKVAVDTFQRAVAGFTGVMERSSHSPAQQQANHQAHVDWWQFVLHTNGRGEIAPYLVQMELAGWDIARIERLKELAHQRYPLMPFPHEMVQQHIRALGVADTLENELSITQKMVAATRDALIHANDERQHRLGIDPGNRRSLGVKVDPAMYRPAASPTEIIPVTKTETEIPPPAERTVEAVVDHFLSTKEATSTGAEWPSATQVRTAARLLTHIVGPDFDIGNLAPMHITRFVDLCRILPNRWGRTADEARSGINASLERARSLPASEVGIAPATINKHLTWLRQLRMHAVRRSIPMHYVIDFSIHRAPKKVKVRKRDLRMNWSATEMARLLEAPPYTGCASIRDEDRYKPGDEHFHDSRYFGPLLMIHHGNRSAEFFGMGLAEVYEDAEIPYFSIVSTKKRPLKTAQSERDVPIHPELIRLGFLEYVRALRAAGEDMLFPELEKVGPTNFSDAAYDKILVPWRRWAFPEGTSWRHRSGGAWKDKDQHSFRGVAASMIRDVPDSILCDILGHEHANTTSKVYRAPTPLPVMLEAMIQTTPLTASLVPRPLRMRPANTMKFGATSRRGLSKHRQRH